MSDMCLSYKLTRFPASEGMNVLTVVLRSSEEPVLNRMQMHRLARAHRAHTAYLRQRESLVDSDDDEGPQDEDAWLLEDLKVLTHLYSRLKDREQLIDLIFEASTKPSTNSKMRLITFCRGSPLTFSKI